MSSRIASWQGAARCMVAWVLLAQPLAAQDRALQIDSMFQQWSTRESPGAAVLVMHRGQIVHAKGYGMANLEHGVPIGPKTVFDIASVSKQFGAMAIALLEADGLIAMNDDVRKYLPALPDFGDTIRIRHLVHHTSGIRDWPGTLRMAGWDFQDVLSMNQILRMVSGQRELNFKPGEAYAYSNTGYNILAALVRRVSGKTFRQFTEERIFRPLGMNDTHFHDDHTMIVPNRAESYGRTADGYRHITNNLTALGSSSLFTTIEDLARWVTNFNTGTVGGKQLIARLHQRGVLNNGDTIPYAFGQSVSSVRGLRSVSHSGSWAGYRSVLQRFPEQDFAVVILANSAEMNPQALAMRITQLYLGDTMTPMVTPPAPPPQTTNVRAPAEPWAPGDAELRAYTGAYNSSELMATWVLEVIDGRLTMSHFRLGAVPLQPVARDRFQSPFGEIRFQRDAAGAIVSFTATNDRVRNLRFDRER